MSKRLMIVVWLVCLLSVWTALQASSASSKLTRLRAGGTVAISQVLQTAVEKGEIPGVVAAITNREQVITSTPLANKTSLTMCRCPRARSFGLRR